MTFKGRAMLVAALSIGSVFAEKSASIVGERGAAARQPAAAQLKPKPAKWFRRVCALDVEAPVWLSSHGIPDVGPSAENPNQTYRLAVQPDPSREGTPAGAGE